jgi:hypothetical protein
MRKGFDMKLKLAAAAGLFSAISACGQSPEAADDQYAAPGAAPRETITSPADAPADIAAAPSPEAAEPAAGSLTDDAETVAIPAFATRATFEAFVDEQFKAADSNADGALSRDEFVAVTTALESLAAPIGETGAPAATREMQDEREADVQSDRFAAIARDDDLISEGEFAAAMLAEFDVADTNKDETLDPVEQKALASKLAASTAGGVPPSL